MDYKNTLNLPKTEFPMKASLPRREPEIAKIWDERNVVRRLAEREAPWFVLHDGPPYSNGHIHLGQALNKVLKDMVNKFRVLEGMRIKYIPGWDTHGMPIENEVTKHDPEFARLNAALREELSPETRIRIREKCRVFALHWVDVQKEEFRRLGVLGDWAEPYLTISKKYESQELEILALLVERGYIYRGHMPIHWCPTCRTALAMVEIDYKDKTSPSLWFLARLKRDPSGMFRGEETFALVWTTTPWTLLANRAFAFGPDIRYIALSTERGLVILAEALLRQAADVMPSISSAPVAITFYGRDAEGLVFENPLFSDLESPAILSEYVSLDAGSGIVHTAPGHGREDYEVGKRYGLPIFSPVDEGGRFTREADEQSAEPLSVEGLPVDDGGKRAVERLAEKGLLVQFGEVVHQYPYCWRCKKPLIFRATSQWFLNVDHLDLRKKALGFIKNLKWVPPSSEAKIYASVSERPDWCISRQRHWGVYIPALICSDCGADILDPRVIRLTARIFSEEGSDAWITQPTEKFLPEGFSCPSCGGTRFEKGNDILDVWFDSGVTSLVVLPEAGLPLPSDVYLEGPDQHRGWFNASLMISVATIGQPPYKEVITHGWVLDEKGYTMHKSLGNAISPLEVVEEHGADVLRLWVGSTDYTQDIRLGKEILSRTVDAYRKMRNTFRFCLGNLYDFNPGTDSVAISEMPPLDRFILHRLSEVLGQMKAAYEDYEFHRAVRSAMNFMSTEVSALYMDAVKDRLYTWAPRSLGRRSAQTVLYHVARTLDIALSPIISFTAEEVHSHLPGDKADSVFLELWPDVPPEWRDDALARDFELILGMRDVALLALERARASDMIGNSLEASLAIHAKTEEGLALIRKYKRYLPELLIVSGVRFSEQPHGSPIQENDSWAIGVERAPGAKCARCWVWHPDVGANEEYPDICPKCVSAIEESRGTSKDQA
ncbi:MAG: isoleucine--tRNA ligase [candidate division WOR-3 bacterium]